MVFVLELLPEPPWLVIVLELPDPLPDCTPESLGLLPCCGWHPTSANAVAVINNIFFICPLFSVHPGYSPGIGTKLLLAISVKNGVNTHNSTVFVFRGAFRF